MKKSVNNKRILRICLAVVVLLLSLFLGREWHLQSSQQDFQDLLAQSQGIYNDNRIVLSGTTRAKAEHLADLVGGKLRITKTGTFATITLPDGMTLADVAHMEELRPYLKQFSLDYNNFTTAIESTESEEEAGTLRSTYQVTDQYYPQQTYLDYINIGSTWDVTRGVYPEGEKVVVAVIDTGIDTDHPDFFDADGKTIISSESYDATDDMIVSRYGIGVIEDEVGHGTYVAGVIAAQMNEIGIAGIAPEVELLVIKVDQNKNGSLHSMADLVFGIYYAIEKDADVINMSWAGGKNSSLEAALQLAIDSDIIPVAAAGNDSTDADVYPAAYATTIGVGALGAGWELADYSNYGINSDLVAPGSTLTTCMGGGYGVATGTSLAAPVVTAAVALYISQNKYVYYDELKEDLLASCRDLGELGEDYDYGFGGLDIDAFVCQEKGTITFDYCTEEIATTTQVFVRHHTIQTVPEPERNFVVFDDWYYDKAYTQVFDYDAWYSTEFVSDITLYAKWVNEDDVGASVYNYRTLDDGTVEIVSYKGKRRYLEIPETLDGKVVSSIGSGAFSENRRLRQVTFPSGLVHIKDKAFFRNHNLRELIFTGTQLLDIGANAFEECALRSLTVPDSVISIGGSAFVNNRQLRELQISENSALTNFGAYAFSNCPLTTFYIPRHIYYGGFYANVLSGCRKISSISVHPENQNYAVWEQTLYNQDISVVIYHPATLTGSYTTPDTVIGIEKNAFQGSSVTQVILKDTVKYVEECAFSYSKLEQITLSENLTEIDFQVFMFTDLLEIHIPANIMRIKDGAFMSCFNLARVSFGENSKLLSIEGDPGNRGAFEECNSLSEFAFPDSVRSIGELAFAGCDELESIYIPGNVHNLGSNAFYRCPKLKTVEFDPACPLEIIPDYAFANCSSLEQVTFSSGILELHQGAFQECFSLRQLNFPADSVLKSVDRYCFYSCTGLEEMQLPESVEIIEEFCYAFSGLRKAEITTKISEIGDAAFGACGNLTEFDVAQENSTYTAQDNVLFSKDMQTLYCVPASRTGTYSIPGSVKIIAPYSFYYDGKLTGVVFPDGLDDIMHDAFYRCEQLAAIDIPASVSNIGRCAFMDCFNLKHVTLPENGKMTRLGIYTFVNCGMEEITIPAAIETMGQAVFSGCNKLKTVTFSAGSRLPYLPAYVFQYTNVEQVIFEEGSALTHLQAHAFDGASQLKSVDFGDAALEEIDNFAFYRCYNLLDIQIPDTVTYLGRYSFYGCNQIQKLFVPASVEFIGEYAFARTWISDRGYVYPPKKIFFESDSLPAYLRDGWDNDIAGYFLGVSDYVVTDTWEYTVKHNGAIELAVYKGTEPILVLNKVDGLTIEGIGARCFKDKNISSITLPDTLLKLGNHAFYGCGGLKELKIPASVEEIGSYVLGGKTVVHLPEDSRLRILGDYAFHGGVIDSLTLPDTVEEIGDYAFAGVSLKNLTIRESSKLKRIGDYAFADSTITELYLPASLEEVGVYAFTDTPSMTELVIAGGDIPLKLSNSAFENCGFPEVNLPARVYYIGEYTFGSCQNLLSINVDEANESYTAPEGVLYDIYGTTLIQYPCGREGAYEIPAGCSVLTYASFKNAKKLTEVTFAEGCQVRTIGWQTFDGCESLTKITVPDTVVSFDFYAFRNCTALTDVILGENSRITGVYQGAFYNCTSLTNISLPDSVIEISDYAFYNCKSLTAVPLSENAQVKGIYDYAFYNCEKIAAVPAFSDLQELGAYAFGNSGVTEFHISRGMLEFSPSVFAGCKAFTKITCDEDHPLYIMIDGVLFKRDYDEDNMFDSLVFWPPNKVLELGKDQIYLTRDEVEKYMTIPDVEVVIADSITRIGEEAFMGFAGMRSVNIPENVTIIGARAFEKCTGLQDIYFNATAMQDLEDYIFNYAGSEAERTTVTVGKNVTRIPANLFYARNITNEIFNDTHITELIFEEGSICTSIGDNAFKFVYPLQKVTLPEGLASIGEAAFRGCDWLEPVRIPSSVNSIGYSAFAGCHTILIFPDENRPENLGDYWDEKCAVLEESVTWGITEDRLMYYVNDRNEVVICNYQGKDSSLEIPAEIDGMPVTTLAPYSFYGLTEWFDVVLPDSVTTIGEYAFAYSGLGSIRIDSNITTIGNNAFREARLQTVEFNAPNLETLGENLFSGIGYSNNVGTDITIGADMDIIPDRLFYNAVIRSITFAPGNQCHTIGSTAFGNDMYTHSPIQELNLPDTVTTVGSGAFAGLNSLQLMTLPEAVTSVGDNAFNCTNLIIRVSPEQMDNLGDTWYGSAMPVADYKELYMDENGQVYVIRVDDTALVAKYHGADKKVVIPAEIQGYPVTAVAVNAFLGNQLITEVQLPDSITEIGDSAFYNCYFLTDINIPSGVTAIPDRTFYMCSYLPEIHIPEGITSIGDYAFYSCTHLEALQLPDTVEEIGQNAFRNCDALVTVEIPGSITRISDSAFRACDALKEVHIKEGVEAIGREAFYACAKLEKIEMPNTLTTIEGSAFFYDQALAEVYIPASVTSFHTSAFDLCPNVMLFFGGKVPDSQDPGCTYYENVASWGTTEDGFFYLVLTDGTAQLVKYHGNAEELVYPSQVDGATVTRLPDGIFRNCTTLQKITLPDTITEIGKYAFDGCTNLTEIILPESLQRIEDYAFNACRKLKDVNFPDSLEYIGDSSFHTCTSFTRLILPDSITSISDSAFSMCTGVTSVKFPRYLTTIGRYAFYRCGCQEIVIPASVTQIGDYAFADMSPNTILVEGNVTTWGVNVFPLNEKTVIMFRQADPTLPALDSIPSCCTDVKHFAQTADGWRYCVTNDDKVQIVKYCGTDSFVIIPSKIEDKNVTGIANLAFWKNNTMTDLVVPNHISEIRYGTFKECTALKNAYLPNQMETIGSYAFSDCISLVNITLPGNLTELSQGLFRRCCNLNTVQIPESVAYIHDSVFDGCTNLEEIVIPENVEYLGFNAFAECSSLTRVEFRGLLDHAKNGAFAWCTGISEIEIGIQTYDWWVFRECTSLKKLSFLEGVTHAGQYTFEGCTSLEEIHIPASMYSCDRESFPNCPKVKLVYILSEQISNYYSSDGYPAMVWPSANTIAIGAEITSISPDITEKYTYTQNIFLGTVEYVAYSDHEHQWVDAAAYVIGDAETCRTGQCCTVCGLHNDTPAQAHTMTACEAKAPTCTDTGWEAYETCTTCGYSTCQEIPATGHSTQAEVTDPSCTDRGFTTHTCTVCGDSWEDSWVSPLGHSWKYRDNGDGTHDRVCETCGTVDPDDEPHSYTDGKCCCGAEEPEEPKGLLGDLNLDGVVNSDDLTLLARHVGGIEVAEGQALLNADVNGDGLVNSDDLTKHARYVGGIITSWDQE